ncbi:hypothetical protein N0V90_009463 [Kalmusia sp. IMI 367209]|nr:hypothetical protein N0V90_009463 [Kalmusia sp. IMI 367209]
MRASLLAAVLSLGLSGAFANVICDTKRALGVDGSDAFELDDTIESCIESFCSSGSSHGANAAGRCESVLLTITQFDESAPIDKDDCTAQFDNILDQCVTAAGSQGGTLVDDEALYEAHLVEEEHTGLLERDLLDDDDESSLEARGRSRGGRKTKTGITKTRKTKATPKKTKTKSKKTKTKGKKKAKGKAKKQCKAKKGKKTKTKSGKKTVRNLLESIIPSALLPRAPTGNGSPTAGSAAQGEACELPDTHYVRKGLDSHVIHYHFDTTAGWKEGVTDKRALEVMRHMKEDGNFNVVALTGSKTYCIGEPTGGTRPFDMVAKAAVAGKSCLITNGNFFVMGGTKGLEWQAGGPVVNDVAKYDKFSVGFTTTTEAQVDIPDSHIAYYEEFKGDDGSSMMCGPGLKTPLDMSRPELQYWCKAPPQQTSHSLSAPTMPQWVQTVYAAVPGSLAHVSQPNERLVTVILTDELKYVFSYTSMRRKGMDLNQMRDLIKVFLGTFPKANIREAKQVLNLDGGGSIFVDWVKNGKHTIIAAGGLDGGAPGTNFRPRTVQTMVRHEV